ncbi:MAG: hypothetical protein GX346_00785, partial [Clostridiales bacterium]|nr:hypothetical protein [Clostridiales bacterium]
YPMKGYTFTKNGTIFQMIGMLSDEINDEYQEEMEKTVDAMISTLREEREPANERKRREIV